MSKPLPRSIDPRPMDGTRQSALERLRDEVEAIAADDTADFLLVTASTDGKAGGLGRYSVTTLRIMAATACQRLYAAGLRNDCAADAAAAAAALKALGAKPRDVVAHTVDALPPSQAGSSAE